MPLFDPSWAIPGLAVRFNEPLNGSGQVLRPVYDFLNANPAGLWNLLLYSDEYASVSAGLGGTWVYSGGMTVREPRRVRVSSYVLPGSTGQATDAEVEALRARLQAEYTASRRATMLDLSDGGPYVLDLAARALAALTPFSVPPATVVDWNPFVVLLPIEGSFEEYHETARVSGSLSLFDFVISRGLVFGVPFFVDQADAERSGDMVSFIDAMNRGPGDGRLPWLYRRMWSFRRSTFRYDERAVADIYSAIPTYAAPFRAASTVLPFFDATEGGDDDDYTCVMPRARFLDLVIWRTLRVFSNLANVGASFLNVDSTHIVTSSHAQEICSLYRRYVVGVNNSSPANFVSSNRTVRPVQRLYPSNARAPF